MAAARSSTKEQSAPFAGFVRQRSFTSMQSDRGLPLRAASKNARTLSVVVLVDDRRKVLPLQGRAFVAEEALDGVIHEEELAFLPEDEDEVGGMLYEIAIPFLGDFQPLAEDVVLGLQPFLVEGVLHSLDELVVLEGLAEIVVGPAFQGLHGRFDGGVTRHHDDRHVGIARLHVVQELVAVHFRHHEVQQHEVAVIFLQPAHGFPGRRAGLDLAVPASEQDLEALAHPDLVVHNEDFGGSRHCLLRLMLFS